VSAHPLQLSPQAKKHFAGARRRDHGWERTLAKQRNLPRVEGHRHGAESVRAVVRAAAKSASSISPCSLLGRNWSRPKEEVRYVDEISGALSQDESPSCSVTHVASKVIGQIYRCPNRRTARTDSAPCRCLHAGQIALFGPASVPIHDHGDVRRENAFRLRTELKWMSAHDALSNS